MNHQRRNSVVRGRSLALRGITGMLALCAALAARPIEANACTQPPAIPPEVTCQFTSLTDITVTIRGYSTFGAVVGEFCVCGLQQIPAISSITNVGLYYKSSNLPVVGFSWAPSAKTTLEMSMAGGGGLWQGFLSGSITSPVPPGVAVYLRFEAKVAPGTTGATLIQQLGSIGTLVGTDQGDATGGLTGHHPGFKPAGPVAMKPGVVYGDPHYVTFDNLSYDFNGTGDYVVAAAGPSFTVQARFIPWVTTPNTTWTSAAAVKLGPDTVVVQAEPPAVYVNGVLTEVGPEPTLLAGGGSLSRTGSTVTATSTDGHAMDAVLHARYLDVLVRLNHLLTPVTGLLGNSDGNTKNDLALRDGATLTQPLSFSTMYDKLGPSWQVRAGESLFGGAPNLLAPPDFHGGANLAPGAPATPWDVTDLDPAERASAGAACSAAHVTDPALHDACTMDMAALHDPDALTIYASLDAPTAVMRLDRGEGATPPRGDATPPDAPQACALPPGGSSPLTGGAALAIAALATAIARRSRKRD